MPRFDNFDKKFQNGNWKRITLRKNDAQKARNLPPLPPLFLLFLPRNQNGGGRREREGRKEKSFGARRARKKAKVVVITVVGVAKSEARD